MKLNLLIATTLFTLCAAGSYAQVTINQEVNIESFEATQFNVRAFKHIQEEAEKATQELAHIYGEPELLKGYGRRNSTTMAIAPTTSSSAILGQVSPGIEPFSSNYYKVGLSKRKLYEEE